MPYGKRVIKQSLADYSPTVAAEWHPTKNGVLTPSNVAGRSHKKAWFKCKKNHDWYVNIASRAFGGSGCPYCANQKVCEDNCLATVSPLVAKEWHPTKV